MRILQNYAQISEHGRSHIIGNREGLLALKEAVEKALEEGYGASSAMCSDYEGYEICVMRNDAEADEEAWHELAMPYWGEHRKSLRENYVDPEELAEIFKHGEEFPEKAVQSRGEKPETIERWRMQHERAVKVFEGMKSETAQK